MNKFILPLRAILTMFLICAIYDETGIFTALGFGLLALSNETVAHYMRKISKVEKLNEKSRRVC